MFAGQITPVLQFCCWMDKPKQGRPPLAGAGLSHTRVFVCTPDPQVTEHGPHPVQLPQAPLTFGAATSFDVLNGAFCFLMRSATLNIMSTIGTNIINILFKYKISPHKRYHSTYASVAKCIAVMYDTNVSDGDKIQASVLRDCINMRDNTSHYNCLTYDEATCVIDYVALA